MYGTGLHELETQLADILEELVEVIEKRGNQAFVIEQDMYRTIAASMWLMVSNNDQANLVCVSSSFLAISCLATR